MDTRLIVFTIISIWGLGVVLPGPNFFLTVQTAIAKSRRSALFVVFGLVSGTLFWGIAGFFGISALFTLAPWLYRSMQIIGGAYLVYLGIKLLRGGTEETAHLTRLDNSNFGAFRSWKLGVFTILSNPKTAMFVSSLFASALPRNPGMGIGLMSILLMISISTIWYTSVALILSTPKMTNYYQRTGRWIDGLAGCLFVGFGIKLLKGSSN